VTPDATRTGQCRAAGASTSAAVIAAQAGAKASAENFPVALRFLPRRYRGHLAAVYGFARSVDDMGDEAAPQERAALLDELEADVRRLYRMVSRGSGGGRAGGGPGDEGSSGGPPRISAVRALAPAVVTCAIPAQPFYDLIAANRQDQVVSRYPTFGDLEDYCRLSANPVGRIVLHVFGAATPEREALSDRVCTALQLAEHWQDVGEDYARGRIYLPQEDLERFGVEEDELDAATPSDRLQGLLAFEVERGRRLLEPGIELVRSLSGRAKLAVAGYVGGGRAAFDAIESSGYAVLRRAPKATGAARAKATARVLLETR
jgi:squalene synthase HpnC